MGEKQDFKMVYERSHAVAYLNRKMPYTFQVYKRIFAEVQARLPHFKPETLLDYGAGLGSGFLGAIENYKG